jgi:fatty-acyl-CoA synthase
MIHAFKEDYGVEVLHAWGMTELSPLGTLCSLKNKHMSLPLDQQMKIRLKQGRSFFGVDLKILNDQGQHQVHDGQSYGDLYAKGSWVINKYFKQAQSPLIDGWFPTGDVATMDEDGYMQVVDRTKDVIKSGGEWISSIDIENIAVSHPNVAMAACIAMADPKWDERPVVVVVVKPGLALSKEELLAFYVGKTAKWQIPDDVIFVDAIPIGATGKILKNKLREDLLKRKAP